MWGFGLTEIFLLVVLVVMFALRVYVKPKKNLPPGPTALPIVGNIFQMTDNAPKKMAEWAQEYGKMYKLQLGTHTAIVLNDLKLIKEVLSDANFSIRPHVEMFEMFSGGPYGVIMTNLRVWEEQRRWSLRKLRDFGFGKTSMEGLIMDEVNEVLERLKQKEGEHILIKEVLDVAALNAIWTLMNGQRMSQTDPKIRGILDAFHKMFPLIAKSGIQFAPWLKYLFPAAQKELEVVAEGLMKYSRSAVAEHFETHREGQNRDFIDEYISEIKRTSDPKSSFYGDSGRKNLEGTVSDLIQGGSETTSNTLTWLLIYLCEHPEVQRKLHVELDAVVGNSRAVQLSDKPNLPYTEAVIYETLRHSSLVAGGALHSAIQDKEVQGYVIPKGAWIMSNTYFVHHDPAIWGDPKNFRPERFLSPDGKKAVRHEALIPFQIGRRMCLGKNLAEDSMFLFTGNIFQQFKVEKLEKGEAKPISGLFLVPQDVHLGFQSRDRLAKFA